MDDSRIRKASDLLGTLLSPEVAAKADTWSRFFGFWSRAAGENLAAHSRPVDVRNGIVFVEAEHPGWIQLLQMDQNRILETIRRTFPELGVSGIAFKLAKDGSMPGTARVTRLPRPESEAQDASGTPGGAPGEPPGGQSSIEAIAAAGDRARVANGGKAGQRLPTVAQTLGKIEDDSFRSIMSSLAETLDEANKEAAREKRRDKAGTAPRGGETRGGEKPNSA